MLVAVGVVVALLVCVTAESTSMESSTCLTLDPYDAALPQTAACPYQLLSSRSGSMHNQDSVILTIKTKEPRYTFKEFIVQARDNVSGVAVGKFMDTGDADIRMVNCFARPENTAIEFDPDEPKKDARMRWMPEFDYEGAVTFLATVVQAKEVFWLREVGETVTIYNPW